MPYAVRKATEGEGYEVYETELDEVKFSGPKEECDQKSALFNAVESDKEWSHDAGA
jgi:hypothetical protein